MMIALFFDTETTGFKHGDFIPEIVQIGAILQDIDTRRVLAELNVIVRTENPIPEEVSKIHGITDDLAGRFGLTNKLAEQVFSAIVDKADLIVAHNLAFDIGIIEGVWPVANIKIESRQHFCTMLNSVDLVGIPKSHGGGNKWPKLMEAYKHFFGDEFDGAHDAMADVRACRDVYFKLHELKG